MSPARIALLLAVSSLVACGSSGTDSPSASATSASKSAAPVASAAPSASPKKGKVTIESVKVTDGPEADIKKIVEAAQPKLEACYEEVLSIDPKKAGKVKPQLVCDDKGECLIKSTDGGMDNHERVSECVIEVLDHLAYPRPAPGKLTAIDIGVDLTPN